LFADIATAREATPPRKGLQSQAGSNC